MKTELLVALIAGAIGLTTAGGTIWSSIRNSERTDANAKSIEQLKIENDKRSALEQRLREISKYSEPLTRSAYDLQSRFFNILRQNLVEVYLRNGSDREKTYVKENTTFLMAQYMCWTEIVRREVSLTDLSDNEKTRNLIKVQDDIYGIWGSDRYPPLLRVFAGEQRAIGEALMLEGPRGPECMGYNKFLNSFGAGANPLIDALRDDVEKLETNSKNATDRMTKIQNALIDLLLVVDPQYLRFAAERRTKA